MTGVINKRQARVKSGITFALAAVGIAGVGCVTPDRLAGALRGSAEARIDNAGSEAFSSGRLAASSANDAVFFVDGAGGGGLIIDWSREIRRGLNQAGFRGQFRPFVWQTGLGPVSDECASVEYKREKARRLVNEIRDFRRSQPEGSVHLVAASAGTAVAVFALEAMNENETVDSVVLLSSALSSTYDLTSALRHVDGEVHVFTSPKDALLRILMPVLGTSDREYVDHHAAGLEGFVQPAHERAAAEYAKVREVPWRAEWKAPGHPGGHTDCKSPAFVREVVAPLLLAE